MDDDPLQKRLAIYNGWMMLLQTILLLGAEPANQLIGWLCAAGFVVITFQRDPRG
jgi:hypothetical protein